MKKLALLALTTAALAIGSGCTAGPVEPEDADENVDSAGEALMTYDFGWAYVTSSGGLGSPWVYNSKGGSVVTSRLAAGQYSVDFNGIAYASPSNAQVATYGGNAQCKLFTTPTGNGTKTSLYVSCYTPAGVLTDSAFVVTLDKRSGTDPSAKGAFLSTGGGTSPSVLQSWNSTGAANGITWNSTDQLYEVSLPGLSMENAGVHVTALGANANRCKVASWAGGVVRVKCYSGATPVSTNGFAVSYQQRAQFPYRVGGHARVNHGTPDPSYSTAVGSLDCQYPTFSTASAGKSLIVSLPSSNWSGFGQEWVPMVTGYGQYGDYCTIMSWSASGSTSSVTVNCYDWSGGNFNAADALFDISISNYSMPGPC